MLIIEGYFISKELWPFEALLVCSSGSGAAIPKEGLKQMKEGLDR